MLSPIRTVALLRPHVRAAVIAAVVSATFAFSATPFLLGLVSDHYGTGLTVTSFISTGQLLGFAIGSFWTGRILSPSRQIFVIATVITIVANLASATVPPFALLVALRILNGLAMGAVSWYGWSLVFGRTRRTADMSMIGPLAGVISSPIVAPIAERGIAPVYVLLTVVSVSPLFLVGSLEGTKSARRPGYKDRHAPVMGALVILTALAFFTAGGSSLFTYCVLIGEKVGADASVVAWALSGNAIGGVIGARWPGPRGPAGAAMAGTGIMAVIMAGGISETAFVLSILVWGVLFWIGVPVAFDLLARKSRYPEERAGDAQAVMAMGRVAGPLLGGILYDLVGTVVMGFVAAALMIGASAAIFLVDRVE